MTSMRLLSILTVAMLLVAGCAPSEEEAMNGGEVPEDVGATVEEIEGDPGEYIGQTVRVDGQIESVSTPNSFLMEGDWLGGALLVVVPPYVDTQGITFNEGDNVQVTGQVREYVAEDIDEEFGLDFGEEVEYEEAEPVVIADTVTTGVMEEAE